jgi:hypothetical protein
MVATLNRSEAMSRGKTCIDFGRVPSLRLKSSYFVFEFQFFLCPSYLPFSKFDPGL